MALVVDPADADKILDYAREENLEAFVGELMIEVGRKDRIGRASAVVVALFVADKDIEGLFLLRDSEDALSDRAYRKRAQRDPRAPQKGREQGGELTRADLCDFRQIIAALLNSGTA